MKQKLSWLPNMITMGNLVCGFLAVLFATRVYEQSLYNDGINYYKLAMIMMLVAGLFDFFDGFVARKLGVSSDVGRELDSLSDVVSFGVAPALLLYQRTLTATHWFGVVAVAFYVCCSAWRLARFNVMSATTGRKPYFTGMPIEGGAVLLLSVVLSSQKPITSPLIVYVALAFALVAGLLMVSRLRFTADVPWVVRLGALAVMLIGFIFPGPWTFLIPFTYVAYGVICNLIDYRRKRILRELESPAIPAVIGE